MNMNYLWTSIEEGSGGSVVAVAMSILCVLIMANIMWLIWHIIWDKNKITGNMFANLAAWTVLIAFIGPMVLLFIFNFVRHVVFSHMSLDGFFRAMYDMNCKPVIHFYIDMSVQIKYLIFRK